MLCPDCRKEIADNAPACVHCGLLFSSELGETVNITPEAKGNAVSATNDMSMSVAVKKPFNKKIPEDSFLKKDSPINAIVSKFHSLPRNTKIVMVVVFAIILVLMVVAISNSSSKLVGKWDNGDVGYIMFTSDGQYFIDNDSISGTYKVDGSTLIMIGNSNGRMSQCTYKISDDILTITYPDGDTVAFFRSK